MSRNFDDSYAHVPIEIFWGQDIVTQGGVDYARIPRYPDYIATSEGDIIDIRNPDKPKYLKPWVSRSGHNYVEIEGKSFLLHRLIAESYLPNHSNYPIVRHLNDDPYDNRLSNLAWGTAKDNRNDCVRNGHEFRRGVYCFETDRIYRSGVEASRILGVSKEQICLACQGKRDHAKGYHFCYEDEIEIRKSDSSWMHRHSQLKPLTAYGPNGEVYEFGSRKEASEYLGIRNSGISSVLSGRLTHTHGWRFKEGKRSYE